MIDVNVLAGIFTQSYHQRPRIFSTPGRVNLIGEHTDYNEGFVLPMAIDRRTFVAAAANGTREVRVRSLDLNDQASFSLDTAEVPFGKNWLGYVAGVALELRSQGAKLSGTDLAILSDVPIGAGLSSSAALEVSVASALLAVNGQQLDPTAVALVAQAAEHKYVGTRCGIMDQLTVSLAQKDHALLIDCRSLKIRNIKLKLPEAVVVICNTNVKHELASSAYNQRRQECEQAVDILRRRLPAIRSLRDVDLEALEPQAQDLSEVLRRRARHVITENARTVAAASALERGHLQEVGKLMYASHNSLREDFQVSSSELDLLVQLAEGFEGVFGARMTGGGFGGCTVNLVRRDRVELFEEYIHKNYSARSGVEPAIYPVVADEGVTEVSMNAGFETNEAQTGHL
jgi:galactokinase